MNTGFDLTVVVPIWKRADGRNLRHMAHSLHATTPEAQLLVVRSRYDSEGEQAVASLDSMTGVMFDELVVDGPGGTRGDYACKINAGYRATDRPLIFTGADDIEFTPGWYDAARALIDVPVHSAMKIGATGVLSGPGFPPPRVGVVGTNDDANERTIAGQHSTHSLVARWYADMGCCVDRGAIIYHEGYWHEYCDDELVQTAKRRDAYEHAFDSIVRHHHPIVHRADDDETYQRGRQSTRRSRQLYRQRSRLWTHGARYA